MKLGDLNLTAIKIGDDPITKVYLGTELIWTSFIENPPLTGVVSNYSFDTKASAAIDDIGGYNGVLINNITTGFEGIRGLTHRMGGNTPAQRIEVPDNDAHSFVDMSGDTSFTMRLWVKFATVKDTWFIMRRGQNSTSVEYQFLYYQNEIILQTFQGGGGSVYIGRGSSWTPVKNRWYHLVAKYDGSKTSAGLKIYVDGVRFDTIEKGNSSTYTGMSNTGTITNFGSASPWNNAMYLDGYLDEIRMYKGYEWSEAEILADYNNPEFLKFKNQMVLCLDPYNPQSYPITGTTVTDISPIGGGTGVLYGDTSYGNKTFVFDGVGDYIRFTRTDINAGSYAYPETTVNMWIKPKSGISGMNNIYTVENVLEIGFSGTTLQYASNPWAWRSSPSGVINYGEWQMISYTHTSTSRKLFVNGQVVYTSAETGNLQSGTSTYPYLTLMGRYAGTSSNAYGEMGLMELYETALTDTQILQVYDQTKHRYEHPAELIMYLDAADPACYPGTGTTVSNIVGNFTGSMSGGVSYTPNYGKAFVFNGTSSAKISFANAIFALGAGDFTLEVFAYDNIPGQYQGLFSSGGGSGQNGVIMAKEASWTGSSSGGPTLYTSFPTGSWFQHVFRREGSALQLFTNGVYVAGATIAANNLNSTNAVIGSRYTHNDSWTLNGYIGIVKLYNNARSNAQITESYDVNIGRFTPPMEAETAAFMNDSAVAIPNNSTVYYSGTPYQITGAELWTLVDEFIVREKAAGRWTKHTSIKPRIGGTGPAHAVNLINPSIKRGTYYGSWAHSAMGSKGNGVDTYFDSNAGHTSSTHGSTTIVLNEFIFEPNKITRTFGTFQGGSDTWWYVQESNNTTTPGVGTASMRDYGFTVPQNTKVGIKTLNNYNNNLEYYHNSTLINSIPEANGIPTASMIEGADSNYGTIGRFLNGVLGMSVYSDGLTSTDVIGLHDSIKLFEQGLKRSFEPETTVFMNSIAVANDLSPTVHTGINGNQLWVIMDNYITSLKDAGLLDLISVDYPMVGGDATKHAINMMNPSYAVVTWYGGWIHDEFGALGNGSNTYGDMGVGHDVMPVIEGTSNGTTAIVGTNNTPARSESMEIGNYDGINNSPGMANAGRISAFGHVGGGYCNRHSTYLQGTTTNEARGVQTIVRTTQHDNAFYKNGLVQVTSLNADPTARTYDLSPRSLFIGGYNTGGFYLNGTTNQRIQGVIVHKGLDATQVVQLRDIINARETALNRKTW